MKKIFLSSQELDKSAISSGLAELVLQENAARAVADEIKKRLKFGSKIAFLCGSGNNAADAIASARMLSGDYECVIFLLFDKLNQNASTQLNIAKNYGVSVLEKANFNQNYKENFINFNCIVDGIFGSGFNRDLGEELCQIISAVNEIDAFKIAVDIPSGLDMSANPSPLCFRADLCVSMGALKLALYGDMAKDFVGEIVLANLGLSEQNFIKTASQGDYLLEFADMCLPNRTQKNVNKGDFGHAFVVRGQMSGACLLASLAALNMGAGKVSIYNFDATMLANCDAQIMQKSSFEGASAVACGMGLGDVNFNFNEILSLPCVIDADMFGRAEILSFAKSQKCVLTPHLKEFVSLLKFTGFGQIDIKQAQKEKFALAREFSLKFASTLVLKGANTIIAQNGRLYICALGTQKLAVGGSGDALAGIILALLAQNYTSLNAAITGVLAHAKTALNYDGNDFSFSPNDIIKGLKKL